MMQKHHSKQQHAQQGTGPQSGRRAFDAWLKAERQSDERRAEKALFEVFSALPQAVPTSGFSARVLTAAGVPAAGVPAAGAPAASTGSLRPWSSWLVARAGTRARPWSLASRLAVAACLLMVAVSSAFLLPATIEVLGLLTVTEVVTGVVDSGLTVGHRLQDMSPLWRLATVLYRTLLQVVGSPPVLVALLTMTLLSSAALRSLLSLLPARRSYGYA